MVQWNDPVLQERLQTINMNIIFLLLGLYGWEYLRTLQVEYAVIRGRLAFRWALIPYLVGRLFLFIALLILAIRLNRPSANVGCLPSAMTAAIVGDIALGCASANFMIRTWVIWKDSRRVHALLLLFALGHWIVLALDVANLRPFRIRGRCGVTMLHSEINAAVFLYSTLFDFLVLVLAVVRLSREPSKSSLVKRLRSQGIAYFVVSVITCIPPTIFSFMGVVELISLTGFVAITASTIASYRAVRSFLGLDTRQICGSQATQESVHDRDRVALSTQIMVQMTVPTAIA